MLSQPRINVSEFKNRKRQHNMHHEKGTDAVARAGGQRPENGRFNVCASLRLVAWHRSVLRIRHRWYPVDSRPGIAHRAGPWPVAT